MPVRIISAGGNGPVRCTVTEVAATDAGLVPLTEPTSCRGEYVLRFPDRTGWLKIEPDDGHWGMFVDIASPDDVVRCQSVGDPDFPWWQQAVGAHNPTAHSAAGIRIGIIDVLFKPGPGLKHLTLVEPPRLAAFTHVPADGHGRAVSAILVGRGPGKYRALASEAEAFFLDASIADEAGVPSVILVDHARVVDGIRNLSENHGVDIINLSCGFETKDLPDLEDAVEDAADRGTICICAAGNSAMMPVEVPARYEASVAVGGIGFTGVAEFPTFLGRVAEIAGQQQLLGRRIPTWPGGLPFRHHGAASGPEIDVLAPSLGIILKSGGGRISEYNGTSYAAPMVAAVLACALSDDHLYRELSGRDRHDHARRRLGEISVDLRLGRGLPVLQH